MTKLERDPTEFRDVLRVPLKRFIELDYVESGLVTGIHERIRTYSLKLFMAYHHVDQFELDHEKNQES